MALEGYKRKLDFKISEPVVERPESLGQARFVTPKYLVRRLHYVQLEMEEVLCSWVVPKRPSLGPWRDACVHPGRRPSLALTLPWPLPGTPVSTP